MGLFGILLGLALLIWLAYRGWSILLLAPGAALIAAAFSGGPLLAYWTQTFMDSASRFIAQFFPLFLLGALFGKLMEDSGSVSAIAEFMTQRLGPSRAILTVVLAGALVTYGGVSLFVAVFCAGADGAGFIPHGADPQSLDPGDGVSGHVHVYDVGAAWNAGYPKCDPDPVLRHDTACGAGSGDSRLGHHGRLWHVVAEPGRHGCPSERRGVWHNTPRLRRRCGRGRGSATACNDRSRV
jgi:GntP family permease